MGIGGSMGGNTNWMCNSRSHHHHRRPRTWPLHYSFLDDVRVEENSPAATNGSGSGPTISGLIKEEDRGRDQKSKKHFNDGSRLLWVPFDSSLCFLSLPRGAARTACLSLFAISFPMAGLGYLCEYLDSMWAPSPNGRWKKPLWIFLFIVFIFVFLLFFYQLVQFYSK